MGYEQKTRIATLTWTLEINIRWISNDNNNSKNNFSIQGKNVLTTILHKFANIGVPLVFLFYIPLNSIS
jgi:hypothetical protein